MLKRTLEAVGLRSRTDIPAADIFKPAFEPQHYGLEENDRGRLRCLRDFVMEYNREIPIDTRKAVSRSLDAAKIMYPTFRGLLHEEVWALFLTKANLPICRRQICVGGHDSVTLDIRMIIKLALDFNAKAVILFHNHPSGSPKASIADSRQTQQLTDALMLCEINLLDHIIMSDSSFYSFTDDCILDYPQDFGKEEPQESMRDNFEVTFLSRKDLEERGYDASAVTDATMEKLAKKIGDEFFKHQFWISLDTFAEELGLSKMSR